MLLFQTIFQLSFLPLPIFSSGQGEDVCCINITPCKVHLDHHEEFLVLWKVKFSGKPPQTQCKYKKTNIVVFLSTTSRRPDYVATIIEGRGFRIVCLGKSHKQYSILCTADRCVSPVELYARFSWCLFARRFHVLFLLAADEHCVLGVLSTFLCPCVLGNVQGKGVDETWYFEARPFTVEIWTHKHVFFRLVVYLSKCINNQ